MEPIQRPSIKENLLFKDLGSEGILLDPNNSAYFRLNEIGARVFEYVMNSNDGTFSDKIAKLIDEAAVTYQIPADRVKSDIEMFLRRLQREKITS
jgi:hypothetical protein